MRFIWWRSPTLFGPRWRWHLKAGNGEIIAHGQAYRSLQACLDGIRLVKGLSNAITEERK